MANGGYYWVSGKLVYQRDDTAEGIINTIQITDGVTLTDAQKFYVRYIVTNLIRAGIWSKIKALYGFVGGTATTHRWNWKDMRDLDAAYRLTYSGGVTHSSNGIKGDGTTGICDTKLSPNTELSVNNVHLSFFSPISVSPIISFPVEIGVFQITDNQLELAIAYNNGQTESQIGTVASRCIITTNRNKGMFLSSRTSNSLQKLFVSSDLVNTSTVTNTSPTLPTDTVKILGKSQGSGASVYSNRYCAFASIGNGLTDQEAIAMSHIITFAQGILGR